MQEVETLREAQPDMVPRNQRMDYFKEDALPLMHEEHTE